MAITLNWKSGWADFFTSCHIILCSRSMSNQKPRTKVWVLLLLLLRDSRQIFTTPSKSLQASQNLYLFSLRYRTCCGGGGLCVGIVVVVCGKICDKIHGKMGGEIEIVTGLSKHLPVFLLGTENIMGGWGDSGCGLR